MSLSITDQVVNSQVNVLYFVTSTSGSVTCALFTAAGVASSTPLTATRISTNLVLFSFTPTSTGVYYITAEGVLIARIEVVTKSIKAFLQNIEDEALGSWQWDKTAGSLSLLRQDGTSLGDFTITDTLESSSRERL